MGSGHKAGDNEAVKRNRDRFPQDFLFQLTAEERDSLTSQFAMSKPPGRGGRRTFRPLLDPFSLLASQILPAGFKAATKRGKIVELKAAEAKPAAAAGARGGGRL